MPGPRHDRAGAWYRQPVLWLGAAVFAASMAGCIWIIVMLVQIAVFGTDARVKLNLLKLGLFWHFLDIVWIAIFSVVYLQGKL